MPYQSNKPLAVDYMNVSQGDLQGNFLALKALIDVNHETFGSAYEGKHAMVSFPEKVVSLVPPIFPLATSATELGMYAKADGGNTHLFFRPTTQAAGDDTNDINISEFWLNAVGGATNKVTFQNGLQVIWGSDTADAGTNINFAGGGFATAAPYVILAVPKVDTATNRQDFVQVIFSGANAPTKTTFRCKAWSRNGNASTCPIYYLAVGY